ncbi:hypothetical protein PRIPAC_97713 [Pristionchus pacificus]|uniref:Uncharacterized protein n=1 Tax=Pristionchus pacificus TaxID=54126 RepID=A0A2A6B379_PRIPA|nr:hypothetical protein PRIPAC_97713 [Pristionchus pacificus]|eukprot:PDM60318.1 hypothetical protein PRIPAC_54143 [Pristionchus pacificus]
MELAPSPRTAVSTTANHRTQSQEDIYGDHGYFQFLEAIGYIVLFGLYFFDVLDKSKSHMGVSDQRVHESVLKRECQAIMVVGDQNFLMSINALQIFLSLYFTFAYSRSFRFLFPVQEHSEA